MNAPSVVRRIGRARSGWGVLAAGLAAGLLQPAIARANDATKELAVKVGQLPVERINWKPNHGTARSGFTTRGPGCPQVTASVANQFNNVDTGGEITLQAGMIVGEGFGSTYLVPDPISSTTTVNEAFPIEVNLVEFIAGTAATVSGSNGSTVLLGWSVELWDGEPGVGTSAIVFSVESDPDPGSTGLPGDLHLQRVSGVPACDDLTVLLGGAPASAAKAQFSVDQTADPVDRMIVPGNALDGSGNRLNSFTVVVKITAHNAPGAGGCSGVSVCNNAFFATEGTSVNGSSNPATPTFPTRNWLYAQACGGGCPGGYTRFSALASGCRPTRDVLQQVTYTPAYCVGAVTGACCAAGGTCALTTGTACTGTSVYQGDNTTCAAGACPTGACCAAVGTCTTTLQSGCTGSGVFQGTGTVCSPNPCPQPAGACCASGGTCASTSSAACVSPSVFQGIGTTCTAQSCPGACCIGSGCLSASLSDCGGVGGVYQGNGSACVGSACPTGACCVASTGACTVRTPASCTSVGGVYGGTSSACNTTFCPLPVGACCATNGFCLSGQTQSACVNVGFAWQGGGTVCSPSPCSTPGVCCRGSTCATGVSQTGCTSPGSGIGASFTSVSAVCNSTGSAVSPCCYADFNKANAISVQDIFDYLNAWFAASPYCHVGGDGIVGPTVQDIFTFLNAWFAGCS